MKSVTIRLAAFVVMVLAGLLLTSPDVYTQSTGNLTVNTLADIPGDGAAHAVQGSGTARWIQFVSPTANTNAVRVGDSAITGSRGIPIAAGGGVMIPPIPPAPGLKAPDQYYSLSTIYYLVQTGDTVSITWGK